MMNGKSSANVSALQGQFMDCPCKAENPEYELEIEIGLPAGDWDITQYILIC